jgi:hypothetical protein
MTDEEKLYRDALHSDFLKFSNSIIVGYFLMRFKNPYAELDSLRNAWIERITDFRETTLTSSAKDNNLDVDVAKILSKIHDEFDREKIVKEVGEAIYQSIKGTMQNIT